MRSALLAVIGVTMFGCAVDKPRTPNHITGDPRCSDCSVQLMPVITLQSTQPVDGARFPATVVKLEGGYYAVAPTFEAGTAAIFQSGGQLAGILGRFGDGPGEMRNVRGAARWFGDSIAVLHDHNRISVFGADFVYARSLMMNSSSFLTNDIVPSRSGVLLARRTGTSGGSDVELREFSSAGEPLRGFGASTDLSAGRTYAAFTEVGDTIWAADTWRYEFDVFVRNEDSVHATLHREVDWFPTNATRNEWGGLPAVQDFVRFGEGIFLVLVIRPRSDYRVAAARPPSREPAAAAPRQPDHSAMLERFEQIIELLDFRSGEVVAQVTVTDRWFGGFTDRDELFSYEEDPATGEPAVGIWRVEVIGLPSDG